MKRMKLLALALVIGTSSLFAASIFDDDVPAKLIGTQVADLFDTPNFEIEDDLTVNITFTFDSEGKIVVLNVDSRDYDVLNYIRKNMNHQLIQTPGEPNREFIMPLKITK
tara:strand:- start:551 stop:880 length:330 start_codon:yes stop_codon:yes gene_type:complete